MDDYGYFGKGTEGYVQYMQTFNHSNGSGGGQGGDSGKPPANFGCGTVLIILGIIFFIAAWPKS